jgi:microsomal dipeptidase-like Zn-dependent dipeptidase
MKQLTTSVSLCVLSILLSVLIVPSAQAACGAINQRACCIGERNGPACDAGLREVAKGEYPNNCIFGAATCLPLTPVTDCGGEGERNCCLGERIGATCDAGLEEQTDALPFDSYEAVSGDASCSIQVIDGPGTLRSRGTCVRHDALAPPSSGNIDRNPIPEPDTGWTATPVPRGVLRGYHDMHLHLVGHMAHGGTVLSGQPAPIDTSGDFVLDNTYNINTALSPDTDLALHKSLSHGLLNDTPGQGTQDGTRSWYGAPYFSGWPKWTSTTHQQAYYVWLERAWRGGLRATTMLAVHNESLCKTSTKSTRATSWPLCEDSMRFIVEQLKAAWNFEQFIDGLSGGAGQGWFRIVTTPQQARDVIRSGKLAVVLGIEVDNLFNCKEQGCPANFGLPAELIALFTNLNLQPPTTLEEAVNVIYAMGVRHVFPVHNFDNGFGAAATWLDAIGVGQAISEQRWWELEDCGTGSGKGDYGFWIDNVLFSILEFLGFGIAEAPPIPLYVSGNIFPAYASCNRRGLLAPGGSQVKPGGTRLIQALMNKGILIDIDHMSNNSLNETIALTKTLPGSPNVPYPLLASHVQFFDLHQKEFRANLGRHERMRTRAQLDAIRAGGGMIAAMLKDDVQDTDLKGEKYTIPYTSPLKGGPIADNCRHSSKSWAQAFQYGVDVMGGPVAMGSDFNGAAGHLGPRFGSESCGGWGAPNGQERLFQVIADNKVTYPFDLPGFGSFKQQVTGFKAFDYNVDGLAHVGLLPDMVADLQKVGLNQQYVDELFCSAEAYIRVWERADALASGGPAPDASRPWLCNVTDDISPVSTVTLAPPTPASGWHQDTVIATITATDADSGVEKINHMTTSGAQITSGNVTGAQAMVTIGSEGNNDLSYFATDKAGNVEDSNSLAVKIDRTAPGITAAQAPAANALGWNSGQVVVSFTCTDALSGIQSCASPQTLSSEVAGQVVTGAATDYAGNIKQSNALTVRIDKTAPGITAAQAPAANALGWNSGAVVVSFTCTDALSGIQSCTSPQTLSSEVAGQVVTGTATDNADNVKQSNALTVRIDKTAPGITAAQSPPANASGWNNSTVTVNFTCTDALSGIQSCTSPQPLSNEGVGQSATGEAVDSADNSASLTVTDINIDKTVPVVAITGVTDAAVYIVGNVPEAGCSTSDALSGVETNAGVAVTGGGPNNVGSYSVTCSGAQDVAGNVNSSSASYDVHYPFSEFVATVANPPLVNTLKAGRNVPLKFGLGGDYGLNVLQGGAPTSIRIGCTSLAVEDVVEETAISPGASLFSYDPLTSLYQFNWKTAKNWSGTCRRLLLTLDDGTVHAADFKFD